MINLSCINLWRFCCIILIKEVVNEVGGYLSILVEIYKFKLSDINLGLRSFNFESNNTLNFKIIIIIIRVCVTQKRKRKKY